MTPDPPWARSPAERVGADVIAVWNHADARSTVAHLSQVPMPGRALVRPTPGSRGRSGLALDLLLALGKNPDVLARDASASYSRTGLAIVASWITAAAVTDVVWDRAHDLPPASLRLLADTVVGAGARLWLIWSAPTPWPEALAQDLRHDGHRVGTTDIEAFKELIPPRPRSGADAAAGRYLPWPQLPAVDFPTFRAACRRHLTQAQHARVDAAYVGAARAAEGFADEHCCAAPAAFDAALVAFLRDRQIGPHTESAAALIALRGTQAGLLRHGVLLRWDPAACGDDPAAALPGTLTRTRAAALQAGALPVELAATALSLHLNVAPYDFGCWRLADVDLRAMVIRAPAEHQTFNPPMITRLPTTGHRPSGAVNAGEVACGQPIALPEHARPLLAALLAYRRRCGADDKDLLFVHPTDPRRSPALVLRKAVERILTNVNAQAPWMVAAPHHYLPGDNPTPVGHGWMPARGLTVHHLPRLLADSLPARAGHRAHAWEPYWRAEQDRILAERDQLPLRDDGTEFDPADERWSHLWQ